MRELILARIKAEIDEADGEYSLFEDDELTWDEIQEQSDEDLLTTFEYLVGFQG